MKDFIVLIPYFNNPDGLMASLKSISYPTDKFEVLIVDDGSKVTLNEGVLRISLPSISLNIVTLPQNSGVAKALNKGLEILHKRNDYKYIARLDCGDTCNMERFTKQVSFMNEHPQVYLLGTWCSFTDSVTHKSYIYKTRTEHEQILKEMHFKCSFIHPTVMFKREVLDTVGYYPENYPHAEDYAYFWKIIKQFKCTLLPEVLVDIEANMNTISAANYKKQALSRAHIIKAFGMYPLQTFEGRLLAYLRALIPYSLVSRAKRLLLK